MLTWQYLRWYFKPASVIHAGTQRVKEYLRAHKIQNPIETFPLGVDMSEFYFEKNSSILNQYKRPYFIAMSRMAREKNLEAYLELDLPGTKFVMGNGPHKKILQKKYGHRAVFLPYENVRQVLSAADVFVFPSRYDTFGLTNLEALACGLPIASYPVMGPADILQQGVSGFACEDLKEAALACLDLRKEDCIQRAQDFSWERTAEGFLKHQVLLN
jgi:glycosyltransferase involved in cell wall biosynthesis